ncbi:MAG: putative toxin-antitoxin system toxin component, PIN family [Ruminococcus sp.]|nr:putative toxin-antitoxin system toxin component, PIN family [Ruminococcus sp.]MCM1382774.1 putative toxin-antitoxin system toxin component, PIN family [Muribaculaceae bacterium]MCM1480601.1 putative toxin-antitoxin system toxin component, PIN family [Muribaculaceae bacterium]
MTAVIDTNILVSALWSKKGAPARVVSLIIGGEIIPCYDYRILDEYRDVLKRPKFKFTDAEVSFLLDWIVYNGRSVVAKPLDVDFADKDDKKFYEVAKSCGAKLITGNIRHFPDDELVLSVNDFLEKYGLR